MSDTDRYLAALHAMQSGVAMEMNIRSTPTEPKHLRTGLNVAMCDHGALAKLLMDKGVITEGEYLRSIADAMEAEQGRYEQTLSELLGKPVSLA